FVTHDQEEAMEVADRVVVMNQGKIEQQGAPSEVYDHPATPFVLQFLGNVNLFARGSETDYVRPHEIDIVAVPEPDTWSVTVGQMLTVGPNTRIEFKRDDDGSFVDVELTRQDFLATRERLGLVTGARVFLKPRHITRFAA
ncbi:MAG: TOBE-like domain-containing protein, partial [Caulobacter sp.]|nr:TOBE-like domain-containing protein [Vitreoscilla sp.]